MAEIPSSSFLTAKTGSLPNWGWGGLALGGLLAISTWNKNKQTAAAANLAQNPATVGGQPLPSNVVPQYTFVDESTVNVHVPPGGGRPRDTPITVAPGPPPPPVVTPTPTPPPPPPPPPAPPPPPPGLWKQIIPWGSHQGPGTPSTLWGLAENVYGAGQGPQWTRIWNAPQNASLRSQRGDPRNIRPGDNFFVPL